MALLDEAFADGFGHSTRLIMMGSAQLTAGFSLIGFEVWPDATEETLDQVLKKLVQSNDTAVVFLEPYLAQGDNAQLQQLRNQGGNIVIAEIPTLNAPGDYQPQVEKLVLSFLGKSALEPEQ